LLGLAPTQEERSPVTGQLLFRGLSAKVGIFHGPIVKLCPHSTTGMLHTSPLPIIISACVCERACADVHVRKHVCVCVCVYACVCMCACLCVHVCNTSEHDMISMLMQ